MNKNKKEEKKCNCVDLEKTIEELTQKCQEMEDGWKRSQADFANYKRRSEEEKKIYFEVAKGETVESFLPVYDSVKRACLSPGDNADGLNKIINSFEMVLKMHGIEKIEIGDDFNPELAEALGQVDNDDKNKTGKIAAVVEDGFKMGEKIVRPVRVMIYK